MKILPLHPEIKKYLRGRRLFKKFQKQTNFLKDSFHHPSLSTELLEPKQMRIYSFRIDRKYRAIFIFRDKNTIEIIDVNDHYQ